MSSPRSFKRRDLDGDDRQPVIEVFSEEPLLCKFFYVLVGRRDYPYVDLDGFSAAYSFYLVVLEEP